MEIDTSTLLAVFGRFCMAVLWRGFDIKVPIFGPWSGILAGCYARCLARHYSFTDHWLCAFWTAGITARPLDIGSNSCIQIFQISTRTIRCILDRSWEFWEGFVWICLSSVGLLGQPWDVHLFSQEIYAASQSLILRSFERSSEELYKHVSQGVYQIDLFFMNISVEMA